MIMLVMGMVLVYVVVLCFVREWIGNVCDDKCMYIVKVFRLSRVMIVYLYVLDYFNGLLLFLLGLNFRVELILCLVWCVMVEIVLLCCLVVDVWSRGLVLVMI